MKRKTEAAEYVAESSDWTTSPGFNEVVSSPLQTPVSGKGSKGQRASRITKCNRAVPQTPMSNVGQCSTLEPLYASCLSKGTLSFFCSLLFSWDLVL